LTKVSAVKHAPPCETMDHTRPFQLSLVSRWRGPRLLPENRPRRMLLKLLSPILHLLPIEGQINEIVNLHSNYGEAESQEGRTPRPLQALKIETSRPGGRARW
jgi:hypothetical protein